MNINIVIDVQTLFVNASETEYLGRVVAAIEEAKRKEEWIIVVLCEGNGDLVQCVKDVLIGYAKLATVSKPKQQWDGTLSIMHELDNRYLTPTAFTVWGLYAEQCVAATINGLLTEFPCPITVKADACLPCVIMDWQAYARRRKGVLVA